MEERLPVKISVPFKGAVQVVSASVAVTNAELVAVEIECRSKYVQFGSWTTRGRYNDIPAVYILAREDALYLNPKVHRDEPTLVAFPEYRGWEVYGFAVPDSSVVRVIFYKKNV